MQLFQFKRTNNFYQSCIGLQDKNEHVCIIWGLFFIYECMCVLQDGQLRKGHRQTQIYCIEVAVIFIKLFNVINARIPFHNYKIMLEV
jgi:hypothetical protein